MTPKPIFPALIIALFALFLLNLFVGSVEIPISEVIDILLGRGEAKESWRFIVVESRLPQAITAMLCGSALAVCGLLLQTAFHNPLAGPGILGITSGASLAVALVVLLLGGGIATEILQLTGFFAILPAHQILRCEYNNIIRSSLPVQLITTTYAYDHQHDAAGHIVSYDVHETNIVNSGIPTENTDHYDLIWMETVISE